MRRNAFAVAPGIISNVREPLFFQASLGNVAWFGAGAAVAALAAVSLLPLRIVGVSGDAAIATSRCGGRRGRSRRSAPMCV